jgi:hypothetical protein
MVNAWATIGSGGTIIKDKWGSALALPEAFFKDASFSPEEQNTLFHEWEIHLTAHRIKHKGPLLLISTNVDQMCYVAMYNGVT